MKQRNVQQQNEMTASAIRAVARRWRETSWPEALSAVARDRGVDVDGAILLDFAIDFPGMPQLWGRLLTSSHRFIVFEIDTDPFHRVVENVSRWDDVTREQNLSAHNAGTGWGRGAIALKVQEEINSDASLQRLPPRAYVAEPLVGGRDMPPTAEFLASPEITRSRAREASGDVRVVIENYSVEVTGVSKVYASMDDGTTWACLPWSIHWTSWWTALGWEWPPHDLYIAGLDAEHLEVRYTEHQYDGPVDRRACYSFCRKSWRLMG
jgi:hypothetical protein